MELERAGVLGLGLALLLEQPRAQVSASSSELVNGAETVLGMASMMALELEKWLESM